MLNNKLIRVNSSSLILLARFIFTEIHTTFITCYFLKECFLLVFYREGKMIYAPDFWTLSNIFGGGFLANKEMMIYVKGVLNYYNS